MFFISNGLNPSRKSFYQTIHRIRNTPHRIPMFHRRSMSPTREDYEDFESLLLSAFTTNSTLPECEWAQRLMNQPIGNFRVLATNGVDTKADMKYLLFGEHIASNMRGKGKSTGLPCGNAIQSSRNTESIVPAENIRPSDVLVGQGQTALMRTHPGNLTFRKMVAVNFHRYNSASIKRSEKTKISESVVFSIERKQGRFLKPHKFVGQKVALWKRLDQVQTKRKVASTFRNVRKKCKEFA